MSEEINVEELFQECVKAEMSKDDTIIELATKGGMDVTSAVRKYQSLAKGAGLVMGSKERTEKVNELLEDIDITDGDARREAIHLIADTYDVSTATAAAHIRSYAEDNSIELPSQNKNSLEDMVKFVQELIGSDKTRKEIVESLQSEMGYTANSAASAYSRATRELGLSTGRTSASVPLPVLVNFIRENQGMGRKDLAAKISKDIGYTETTAASFLTYVNFAKEWANQEMNGYTAPAEEAA